MPIPDTVIFGPSTTGPITYGQVRSMAEEDQFVATRDRIGTFFNEQVGQLGTQSDGKRKVYSPFPLFLLTCVGIETLGRVFYERPLKKNETIEEMWREAFVTVCGKLDQKFTRKITKKQVKLFEDLWGDNEHKKNKTLALVVFRLGRNTMIHGYQSRGVFLTEELEKCEMKDGACLMNPYFFWNAYLKAFDRLWLDFLSGTEENDPRLVSLRKYVSRLLD